MDDATLLHDYVTTGSQQALGLVASVLVDPGDAGARALMASHPDWVEEVVVPFHAPPDIDRPEDLLSG